MTTLTTAPDASSEPLYRTVPLWVLDVLNAKGFLGVNLTSAKIMPKSADLVVSTPDGDHKVKVYRRDAFPGRSV